MEPLLARRVADVPSSVIRDLLSIVDRHDVLSLAGGLPPSELLPDDAVAEASARVLGRGGALQYGPTEGYDPLRDWIAGDRLGGVDRAGVLVTHGSQQALDLLVRVLVDPGDVVVTETPTYLGMLQALGGSGARIVGVPTDADGLDTVALEASLSGGLRPKLAYLAPTHQNPSGAVMSAARRAHLGALADRFRFVVVDDDPYRELGFEAAPRRLRESVPADLSVTLGTFSKTVAPGLRVGWVHLPPWLRGPMVRAKQSADLHTSTFAQRIIADLVADAGWYDAHCARLRTVLSGRARVLDDALVTSFGRDVDTNPVRGGMFVWATFRGGGVDTDALLRVALEHGVAFVPGSAFDPERRPSPSARLCFASLPDAELVEAVGRLCSALDTSRRAGRERGGAPPRPAR